MKKMQRGTFPNSRVPILRWSVLAVCCLMILVAALAPLAVYMLGTRGNQRQNQRLREQIRGEIVTQFRDIQRIGSMPQVQKALRGQEAAALRQAMAEYGGDDEQAFYAFVLPDGTTCLASPAWGDENPALSGAMRQSMEKLGRQEVTVDLVFAPLFDRGDTIAYTAVQITLEGQPEGFLFWGIGSGYIAALAGESGPSQVLLTSGGNTIFSTTAAGEPSAVADGYRSSRDYAVSQGSISDLCQVQTIRPLAGIRGAALLVAGAALVLCAVLLSALVFLLVRETRRERVSAQKLERVLQGIEKMDLDFRIDVEDGEEFQVFYQAINTVVSHVHELLLQNRELSQRRSRMEIRQLQGQFNPHFVFNILANLQYMIEVQPQQAGEMLSSLSRLLRYSIQNVSTNVLLGTDLKHMEHYLALQKMRFGARLDYRMDIAEELWGCMIPKLLIQPVIENAVKHNLEKTDHLLIEISAGQRGRELVFQVRDNGKGIPPRDLAQLRYTLENADDRTDHIGLMNVHRMLQLQYGPEYGIEIQSVYSRGTTVTLTLPYVLPEEEETREGGGQGV